MCNPVRLLGSSCNASRSHRPSAPSPAGCRPQLEFPGARCVVVSLFAQPSPAPRSKSHSSTSRTTVVVLLRILIDHADARPRRQIVELVEQHLLPILGQLRPPDISCRRATPATTTSPRSAPLLRLSRMLCLWLACVVINAAVVFEVKLASSTWESRPCQAQPAAARSPSQSTGSSTPGSRGAICFSTDEK